MKKTVSMLIVLMICLPLTAEEARPATHAQRDAMTDAEDYTAGGWGLLAFGASALLSPLFGGGAVIAIAYLAQGGVYVPLVRIAEAEEAYDDGVDFLIYQTKYKETYVNLRNRKRARKAWIGTGIGVAVNAALFLAIFSYY